MRVGDTDENLAEAAVIRTSTNIAPQEYTFSLHRLSTSFCLVVYNDNKGSSLPETVVDSLIASQTASVAVKNGRYLEDIPLKAILNGTSLDAIAPTDLRARITYRNNKADEAPVKVNGINVTQTSKADRTVPGYTYYHSFEVDSLSESNLLGINGEYTFTLNTSGIEIDSFPTGFLIEFYNRINSEKILPYSYTEFYTLKQVEPPSPPEVYSIAYDLDGGYLTEDNPTSYDTSSATFTLNNPIKTGYTFIGWTGSNGDEPQMTVTIGSGSMGDRAYTANYSAVSYIISYNLDGGDLAAPNPTGYNFASETFVLNEPTKTGYIFTGWTGSNGDTPQKSLSIVQGSMSDLSFTANYIPISYAINCNLNDGQPTGDNPTTYDITSATITLHNPTKEGYDFIGWTGSNGDTPVLDVSIPQGSTGEKSYTANYTLVDYTISYILGADNVVNNNPTGYNTASETIAIAEPTREGYTFTGWTGTGLDAASMTLTIPHGSTGNKEYTATWNINSYRLDLIAGPNVASVDGAGMKEYNSQVEASCTFNLGYEFDSWSGDFTTETFNMPANNATMTANAKPIVYSITYHLDNGTTTNPLTYDITSATIELSYPTNEGHEFTGWSGTGLSGEDNMTVSIPQGSTGPREYTAHWSVNTYHLDLVAGTGIGSVTGAGDYQYGQDVNATCTILAGYEFDSWSGDIATDSFSMPAQNANMTANAKPIVYTITYNLSDGSMPAGVSNPATYTVESDLITLKNPTKDGIYFMGWACEEYVGASMTVKIPQGSTGNKTYTARWGEVLTFNLAGGVSLVMHKCPAGVFLMGSPNDGELGRDGIYTLRETPQHHVTLTQDFYIGKYEVTQGQYKAVMNTNPSMNKGSDNFPVEWLSHDEITTPTTGFIDMINEQLNSQIPSGYRFDLPTEAQWEYACRAGTTTSLNSGKNITATSAACLNLEEVGWYDKNSGMHLNEVGQKLPNAWWLYDMHGNVYEWCKDLYKEGYYTICGDCIDPTGPDNVDPINYVFRGGSWYAPTKDCRSAYRQGQASGYHDYSMGLRLVLVPIPNP